MRFRPMMLVLMTTAALAGTVDGAPNELGFLDRGELRFRGTTLQEPAALSGVGLVETGAKGARIALEIGGYMALDPGTQLRLTVDNEGSVMVTVARGKVTIETVSGRKFTAGRNSVFRLDRATVRAGTKDEPDSGDE